jgi:glutamate dehydrogenase/leucine dehydrogenase
VQWGLERVDGQLQQTIVQAARRVKAAAHEYSVNMATAAYAVAIEHISQAYQQRGIFP